MPRNPTKKAPQQFVLDCSVTMAWYFKDEANAYAKRIRGSLTKYIAQVPVLWPLEVANVLVLAERHNRSTKAEASKWLAFLQRLPIRVDDEGPVRAFSDILPIARAHKLSTYDASYLELAFRVGLPLASLDDKLKHAAASAGVAEFQP